LWDDSYTGGSPAAMMVQDSGAIISEDGLTQMLRMLSKGDSAYTRIPITTFFEDYLRASVPPNLDTTLVLTYYFKVRDIMSEEDYMTFQKDLNEKLQKAQLGIDTTKIDKYLSDNNINAERTESGIRYVITEPGTGENAQSGQTVSVNYVGYSLEGVYFDTSVQEVAEAKGILVPGRPYQPYPVTIDQTAVIKGWHEALKYMNAGAKGTFYIPSTLAYGPRRLNEEVGKNSVLVFELELIEIK
jgi:FKBP-type peptidyl-prolyl cis-trans isomerase